MENRIEQALDYVERMGARDIDFVRAAHQWSVDQETLEVLYDQRTRQWAADHGYDF